MIDMKQAVDIAMQSAREFYTGKELIDLDLEEAELSNDSQYWMITLSFYKPNLNPSPPVASMSMSMATPGKKYDKKYKLLKINAETGVLISMKEKQPNQ